MSDFFQNGIITTLHDLEGRSDGDLEATVAELAPSTHLTLVLPCLHTELRGPALAPFVQQLATMPWLREIVIGLDRADAASCREALALFDQLPQPHHLIWNDGPRLSGLVEELGRQGLAPAERGKGHNIWLCLGLVQALERAEELGVEVILTDHHTLPAHMPPHLALLHPERTPADSPYRGLAGVGLAYVLAAALCQSLKRQDGLEVARNLFCIGTIADMAPLVGVNRRWLIDGLPHLAKSPLAGLQALQQLAGLDDSPLDAQAIGFQIAPRINAVGRLGDPQLVVELLTTQDNNRALELARECEGLNRQRRELCSAIEAEALALLDADGPQRPPFLLLAQSHWHHGVIGIVAARLVDRFGLPAALLAGEGNGRFRASVRSPKGFAVDQALKQFAPLLERFGGHPAAGGFTIKADRVA